MIPLAIVVLTITGALLYRLGGIGAPFNTKYRDFGVPLCALAVCILMGLFSPWWALVLMFGCMFGSMTTYCKFGNQEDVRAINWALTGMLYGLSALPIAWATGHWAGFAIRTVVLIITIMVWSQAIDEVNLEEGGRGALFVGTIPLLLIGG